MKTCYLLPVVMMVSLAAAASGRVYVASTPANAVVRDFLQISQTDSIDFIRWQLELGTSTYTLRCRYGLSKPSTPDFVNEQKVALEGPLSYANNRYKLHYKNRSLSILTLNENILQLLDPAGHMLAGNGGWSYSLNNLHPVETDAFNMHAVSANTQNPQVYEGRTPCQELSALLGLNKGDACNKMKWYILLYTDSTTGQPSHFLMGGMGYRKETMTKGSWQTVTASSGRISYRLTCDKWSRPLNLLKGDSNTLFFTGADNRPLTGNEDFSYTLNRREAEYPRIEP